MARHPAFQNYNKIHLVTEQNEYDYEHREERKLLARTRYEFAKKAGRLRATAGGTISAIDLIALKTEHLDICPYCLLRPAYVIDHVTPISRGGKSDFTNLVMCCVECNSSKADKPILEFMFGLKVK